MTIELMALMAVSFNRQDNTATRLEVPGAVMLPWSCLLTVYWGKSSHENRRGHVLHHGVDAARPAGARARGARLRIPVGARTHPHSVVPPVGLSGERRTGPRL